MLPETVTQKLQGLSPSPGCYLFKDRQGEVLYVGKAKSLRARVRSYFQDSSGDSRAFIPFLRKSVGDLETIVTATEKEAAILENSLIKEYKPRFNVKLRDDKEYLNLRLSQEHPWPRLDLVRRPETDKARYFGPYHSATAARRTLHLVEKHFQLRTCSDRELEMRKRPCLQYQIKRCPAPCVYEVDRAYYAQQVRAVSLFLDGRHDELSAELETRMRDASQGLEFELAAIYRDQLAAVHSVREQQRVVVVSDLDQDVVGLYREGDLVEISALYVRSGRVVEATSFSNPRVEVPDDEVVAAFLREHYGDSGPGDALIPDEILMPMLPEGSDGVAEWLTEKRQAALRETKPRARCQLISPVRGSKRKLLDMAIENARHAFLEKRRAAEDVDERLARVQQKLRLPTLPRRIECCDISHLGGNDTVGAVVALENGTPYKKRYRTYHVRGVAEGDDYAAMYQVLARRFRRGRDAQARAAAAGNTSASAVTTVEETAVEETPAAPEVSSAGDAPPDDAAAVEPAFAPASERSLAETGDWELPDLFVVDGGRGQLAIALTAARDLGLHDLCVVGLAKERETALGDKLVDRVYLPNQKNPIPLRPNSPELFILARARDEAHRFANRGRKKVGKRRRIASELESIPGVGPKTRKALLTTLGSLQGIRDATDEQILAVPGVTKKQLSALRSWFAVTAAMKNQAMS
ncbi:MAG TPA: excinuclease ABC subunit UvrC [Polyangiaceae bacterium]